MSQIEYFPDIKLFRIQREAEILSHVMEEQLTSLVSSKLLFLFCLLLQQHSVAFIWPDGRALIVRDRGCDGSSPKAAQMILAARRSFVRASASDRDSFFGQRPRSVPICTEMEAHLPSLVQLRNNAAECIRLAEAARTSEHRSFFIEMAERWLNLAERAEKTLAR
jgi:hypothetical protein